jgi:hypothetical protein
MALHTFDVTEFRVQFPQFADPLLFPDATLQGYWNAAICYIDPYDFEYMDGDCLQLALNLLTAHLTALSVLIAQGQNPGFVKDATIKNVTISLMPPTLNPSRQWAWWLSGTPYGAQLLAELQSTSVGGFYVGGLPETRAIRKVGGIF